MGLYPPALLYREGADGNVHSGISIAWLLSNFGASATLTSVASNSGIGGSRCKKKDIVSVSIPETCKAILDNGSEIPLKFSSNLLYGVTVCYSKKTDFILSDVVQIKGQLQRKLFGLESEWKHTRNAIVEGHREESVLERELLSDDPCFDINQWANIKLELEEKTNDVRQAELKKLDFLQEVNNDDETFMHAGSGVQDRLGTLEDDFGTIDMDLNFDIDDLVSQDGNRRELEAHDVSSEPNFELNFNDPVDKDVEQLPDMMEGSLLQEEFPPSAAKRPLSAEVSIEKENPGSEEEIQIDIEPPMKKRTNCLSNHVLGRIVRDETIGLSTDVLRSNFSGYVEMMATQNSKNMGAPKPSDHGIQSWKELLDLKDMPAFLSSSYDGLFEAEEYGSKLTYVERGRALTQSSVASSRSSSDMSTEQGRRVGPNFDLKRRSSNSDSQSHLLPVFLEDEPLPGDYHFGADDGYQNQDFMTANLLPSSIGRVASRHATADSGEHVEILRLTVNGQARTATRRGSGTESSQPSDVAYEESSLGSEFSAAPDAILDAQTKKFYDYIKERADFVGKTTRSHPPFHKKLLFEDLIPSNISQNVASNPYNFKPVSKRIAATAFLSMLNLASKEMIEIETFDLEDKCQVMKGDDIVVYC
ncbi:HFL038Cp [Eremothecium sinecaudum]|uniref:HFL038Cp n=1 Tax=Eremothecium sinecaudum TaxID=45286 RepID=A0A0X8HUU9_9SACH|nr:HFL038Cp [Eremothecium sinecaudum]AMD21818.1 HFL038Cp [Eremothecium sinecaudum]